MRLAITLILFAAAALGQATEPGPAIGPEIPSCCFGAEIELSDMKTVGRISADAFFDESILGTALTWEYAEPVYEIRLGGDLVYRCKSNDAIACMAEAIGSLIKRIEELEAKHKDQ